MKVKCKDVADFLEGFAPVHLAEEWDNVGLLIGSMDKDVDKIMVCLDVTSKVIEEAISKEVDMIISHHPFMFSSIKRINDKSSKGRDIINLIKNEISVYSSHTNLDIADGGVNDIFAEKVGLKNIDGFKKYKEETLYKLVVFVPEDSIDRVRDSICSAGAGWIGNYSNCTFMTKGIGTFKPLEGTNPYIGTKDCLEKVSEYKLETIISSSDKNNVIKAMLKAHPYEEVAYDIYPLDIKGKESSLGRTGILENPQNFEDFIKSVKSALDTNTLRVIGNTKKDICSVAVFSGSFDGDLKSLKEKNVDVLITGDIKYHLALEIVEEDLCVIDAGHFSTEKIIVKSLEGHLKSKFPNIDVICNNVESDPFKTY